MSNVVFCLMGPTASGKTDLALDLVECFPFEIISVDSAMIYRDMTIGTAKPDAEILRRIPHHLIDIVDPEASYSAASFCQDVDILCQQIMEQGKIPLLVGGTMMYFRALQQGLSLLPAADEQLRARLLQQATERGWEFMHRELAKVDALTAERIHPNDTQRIQRALEVYYLTNKPLSALLSIVRDSSPYHFINLALIPNERAWLHQRIALRFIQMIEQGLVEEVQGLLQRWQLTLDHPSMRCVGYRQVFQHLNGEFDLETLIDKGIAATRQLAKRQLTWLRHWPKIDVFSAESPTNTREVVAFIEQILDNL